MRQSTLPALMDKHHPTVLEEWLGLQRDEGAIATGRLTEPELREQSRGLMAALQTGMDASPDWDTRGDAWDATRGALGELSHRRTLQGYTPSETARFVFSLKAPLFALLRREAAGDATQLAAETWALGLLLDELGLYTTELAQQKREDIILRQQQELLELSTPVVTLADGILALPLIGTLDSARTQIVMENLLQSIVVTRAQIAIIDITGVPTVDTLIAQYLLKTVAAARLMGADCIISGIRPQIAQTIVHLGIDLQVVSKATLADAFALALTRLNKEIATRQVRARSS